MNQQVDLRPEELHLPHEMCMICSGIEAYLTVGELAQYISRTVEGPLAPFCTMFRLEMSIALSRYDALQSLE